MKLTRKGRLCRTAFILAILASIISALTISQSKADPSRSPWERVGGDQWVQSVCDHDNRVYVVRNQNYSAVGINVVEGACK